MDIEQKVKTKLLIRGFSNENLLNNRGLIGATIDEAESLLVSGVEELNQKIDNNISRIKADIKKKINEKNILRTQIEILNQELWELEKLMYNEESEMINFH